MKNVVLGIKGENFFHRHLFATDNGDIEGCWDIWASEQRIGNSEQVDR